MSLPFWIFLVVWLLGLAATFLPVVPATLIILAGAAAAALLDGFQWNRDGLFLLVFVVVTVLAILVDNLASAWGARKYGGSKASVWGALAGGVVGGLLLPPLGLFLGPPAGALLAELLIVRRPLPKALRSTWGTVVGLLSGLGAKLGLHLLLGVYGLWHFWPR